MKSEGPESEEEKTNGVRFVGVAVQQWYIYLRNVFITLRVYYMILEISLIKALSDVIYVLACNSFQVRARKKGRKELAKNWSYISQISMQFWQ